VTALQWNALFLCVIRSAGKCSRSVDIHKSLLHTAHSLIRHKTCIAFGVSLHLKNIGLRATMLHFPDAFSLSFVRIHHSIGIPFHNQMGFFWDCCGRGNVRLSYWGGCGKRSKVKVEHNGKPKGSPWSQESKETLFVVLR